MAKFFFNILKLVSVFLFIHILSAQAGGPDLVQVDGCPPGVKCYAGFPYREYCPFISACRSKFIKCTNYIPQVYYVCYDLARMHPSQYYARDFGCSYTPDFYTFKYVNCTIQAAPCDWTAQNRFGLYGSRKMAEYALQKCIVSWKKNIL